jgi:dinuclear metal center YbgI/SA1388 family protein
MIKRDELVAFIYKTIGEDLIEKALQKDELLNGAQFLGAEKVKKVALGVSLNEEFLQKTVEWGSNFCVFHHGFDPRTYKSRYPVYSQKRLKLIFQNEITVMGFHYALDAHPTLGNNATIIKKLGAEIKEPFWDEWGYTAVFATRKDVHDLAHKCKDLFDHEVFVVQPGPKKVKTIGVVSGSAKPDAQTVAEMESKGVELLITGETSESSPHKMKESGINYFVCGHYATEAFGVQELGKKIKSHFGTRVDVEYKDIKNPI